MPELKRDRVSRQYPDGNGSKGVVVLPIDCPVPPGEEVTLKKVKEQDINCAIRDPNEMYDPSIGTGIGDAVFDAGQGEEVAPNVCDAGQGGEEETFFILAEGGGIMTHGDVRYLQEHENEENTP